MRIVNVLILKPIDKMWEIVRNLLTVEDTVYHMAAKETHFDFISQMQFNFFVFVDTFKNVACCGSIREL